MNTGNESHRNVSTPFAVSSSVACIIHSATEEETPKGLEIYGSCFLNLPQWIPNNMTKNAIEIVCPWYHFCRARAWSKRPRLSPLLRVACAIFLTYRRWFEVFDNDDFGLCRVSSPCLPVQVRWPIYTSGHLPELMPVLCAFDCSDNQRWWSVWSFVQCSWLFVGVPTYVCTLASTDFSSGWRHP